MTSSEITESITTIITADQLRYDTELIMKPFADWEKYLTPAPLTIALLGELVFISSKEDFSLNKNAPKDGFVHIKYPESFRATLLQLCHAGWDAFNEAHNNMDQIRLQTASIPNYTRKAVEIIQKDDERLLKKVLPRTLETIDNIVKECVDLSKSMVKKYKAVISLVDEVHEAAKTSQKAHALDLQTTKRSFEDNKVLEKDRGEEKEKIEKEIHRLQSNVEQAEKKLEEALESMPSGEKPRVLTIMEFFFGRNNVVETYSRIRIEQAEKALKTAREELKLAEERDERNRNGIREVLHELRNCDHQKIDFETTLEVLKKGLKALGMIETQWKMMHQFFRQTADIIKIILGNCSKEFIDDGKDLCELNDTFFKDSLCRSFKVNNIASLVQTISSTYTEISGKYIMTGVSSLGALMELEAHSEEFDSERKKLQDRCHEADIEITSLVRKNMKDFDDKTESRIDQLVLTVASTK